MWNSMAQGGTSSGPREGSRPGSPVLGITSRTAAARPTPTATIVDGRVSWTTVRSPSSTCRGRWSRNWPGALLRMSPPRSSSCSRRPGRVLRGPRRRPRPEAARRAARVRPRPRDDDAVRARGGDSCVGSWSRRSPRRRPAEATKPAIGDFLRRIMRRRSPRGATDRPRRSPRPGRRRSEVAFGRAKDLGLSEEQARLLADAVVGG